MSFSIAGKKVWVAGHNGMVGSAVVRRLATENCDVLKASRQELNLTRQADVEAWMADKKPQVVVVAAAVVGGIHANNTRPVDFLDANLQIQSNIITNAHKIGVEKLLFLGSSCIYPRMAPQPINEDSLLTGPLEPTNEWYAIAKIAGVKLCQAYRRQYNADFISAMPTNLYGPGDNFDLLSSHVLPALMVKAHNAKLQNSSALELWGSGKPMREFLHVDDLADACVFLLKNYSGDVPLNAGVGSDVTIRELAELIADVVGFKGGFTFDATKPDGTPRKLLDCGRIHRLGWKAKIGLREGIAATYEWYKANKA